MTIKELITSVTDEYGQLHEDNCELMREDGGDWDGCDCAMADLVKSVATKLVEWLSHDMGFKNEEQRQEAVKMYLEEFHS